MKVKLFYITLLVYIIFGCNGAKSKQETSTSSEEIVESLKDQEKQDNDCSWCNIDNIKRIRLSNEQPTKKNILSYLKCCNEICSLNTEFSQINNYSLFILIQKYPNLIVSTIAENELQLDYLKFILENPVSEEIDLKATIEALASINGNDTIKEKLLGSLDIAVSKSN